MTLYYVQLAVEGGRAALGNGGENTSPVYTSKKKLPGCCAVQTGDLEKLMPSDCCMSSNVHLVCGDSVLTALVTDRIQPQSVTRYRLQVAIFHTMFCSVWLL